MESRERTRTHESEGVEKIRTPIDEKFSFVVRTRPAPGPRYRGQEAPPDIVEAVIEDSESKTAVVDLSKILIENSQSGRSASFRLGEKMGAYSLSRIVRFSEKDLSDPKEIFGLLHELGHVAVADENDEHYHNKLGEIRTPKRIPSAQEVQMLIQNERDAWAKAIQLARTIKREYGVDLFGLFKDADDLMGWLRATGLRTYEEELEELGIGAYTKSDKVRAWQNSQDPAPVSPEDFDQIQ